MNDEVKYLLNELNEVLNEINSRIKNENPEGFLLKSLKESKKDIHALVDIVSSIQNIDTAKNALEKIDLAMGKGMEASSFQIYMWAVTYIRENIYNPQEEILIEGAVMDSAAKYLRTQLKSDDIKNIKKHLQTNSDLSGMSFGLGMGVRNCLRKAGFTEEKLGVGNLDDIWVDILIRAVES